MLKCLYILQTLGKKSFENTLFVNSTFKITWHLQEMIYSTVQSEGFDDHLDRNSVTLMTSVTS